MNPQDVRFIMDFIYKRAGIVLAPDKAYFVEARLSPVARQVQCASPGELVQRLMRGDRAIEQAVIDALTTNETFFFRDKVPFEHLQKIILPKLHATRPAGVPIRIWSAACSTGQEAFSIIMLLNEMQGQLGTRKVEVVASDISESVLARARAGIFNQFEVQRGLPTKLLLQYFTKEGESWKLSDAITRRVHFCRSNLLQEIGVSGRFDIIFCRNVLIYFDRPSRQTVLARLADRLADDGFLLLGGAESIYGITDRFVTHPVERTLYVPAPKGATATTRAAAAV